jgi:hypothetical protein
VCVLCVINYSRLFLFRLKLSYYLRFLISGEFSDPNSPTADHKNTPLSQSESLSQSQNINESQLPSNILEKNQIVDFNDGENLIQDPHELQNNGFDEYGFRDENDFEKSHLNDRNFQNYSREDEDDNRDGDENENENENERMSESYTKYSPQNIPSRRGSQQQQQQQQQQVIVRNNFNKNNHQNQKPRPSPPQRPLSEITVRNTKMSRNPSEFNLNSQNDYPGFEPVSRRKSGNWENREIATQRSRNSDYDTGYSQNTELNDRMRNNQNSNPNSNSNANSNQNNRNMKNKNSK